MLVLVELQTIMMYVSSHMHVSYVHLICSSLNTCCQASLDPSHSIWSLSCSCYTTLPGTHDEWSHIWQLLIHAANDHSSWVSVFGKLMPVFFGYCPCSPFTASVNKINVCKSLSVNCVFIVAHDVDTSHEQTTFCPW